MAKIGRSPRRHPWRFKRRGAKAPIVTQWAKVKDAKYPVLITLEPEHVRQSMKLKGAGNTQTCPGALCVKDPRHNFPHPVTGFVDWLYSRVMVASKFDRNGDISECYRYAHSEEFAKIVDASPGGQRRLLEYLEANGPMEIRLLPPPKDLKRRPGRPKGANTGKRTPRPHDLKGAKRRLAMLNLGETG